MVELVNSFLEYGIRYGIMCLVIVAGCFLGCNLRKKKNGKTMD